MGFYFAWLLHYTSWLMIPSVIGIVIYLIQIGDWRVNQGNITYADAMDSVLNCIYSIVIALWTTFFVESWKRK